jgi:DNA-binding CsgD family transcriptional regulator/tetratricopeptide (TPR) repeat protein
MTGMMLEREGELNELVRLLDGADSAGGRVVLVRGEAGIGKSTLVNGFIADVSHRAHTLLGACDDLLTPQPLAPIWDVARSVSALREPLTSGDRRAVMEGLLEQLSRRERPTVLVLEDMQWADEATLDLITFLGRRIGRTNGLLLLTYRDVEVDAEHPLRRVLGELPQQNVVRMALRRLSARAVSSLIDEATLDVDQIVALTGGNPLFVAEVVATGIERVPFSVRDAVLGRAAKVSPAARRLLEVVSVVPGHAERPLVEALAAPNDALFAECQRHGLLVVGDQSVAFAHELQRRAVESSLTISDRRRLNQEVLDVLRRSADAARLVHHASEAGDLDAIVEFAPRAARAAMAIRSTSEAVAQFRRLEPHLGRLDVVERAGVLSDWAWQEYQFDHRDSIGLFDRAIACAREVGEPLALARVLTQASRANWSIGRSRRALECVGEAIELLEPSGSTPELARALSQLAHLAFDYEDRDDAVLPLVDRAIAVARAVDDAEALVRALTVKGYLRYSRGDMAGMALMEESLQVAERSGDQMGEVITLTNMAGMFGDVRDVARATDFAQRARDTASRYDIRTMSLYAQSLVAEYLLWQGDWDAAENAANDALEASPHVEGEALRVLVAIQARRGRVDARSAVVRMWSTFQSQHGQSALDPAASTMAEYLWLSGDDDPEMIARLHEALAAGLELGRPWPSGPLAFWMWQLGLLDHVPDGSAESYRWMMTGEHRRAAQFWREKGIPYEQGLSLMQGNETEQIEAIRIFDQLGAVAAANNVRRTLAQLGTRVPRGKSIATRDNPAGLTARQAEVLQLLADGLPNAAIADVLFVSHRTVENHVSAILMKLDVSTREAAVESARTRGLLPAE